MSKFSMLIYLLCCFVLGINVAAQPVIQRSSTTRFAVIGDYGDNSTREAEVAVLVQRLAPDFVITVGDNNYPTGEAATMDTNIGKYYSSFIYPYHGSYGQGALGENRFFPVLGNHDWQSGSIQAYTEYFNLPNNERYYDFAWGPVRLFALDSDPHEPDGHDSQSLQAQWLQGRLAATTETWRVVYMHNPPYSSSRAYGIDAANWPYAEWGASLVLGGHAHNYERLDIGGVPYIVNGLNGANPYDFNEIMEGSQFRFNAAYGAMLVEATETSLSMNFYGIYGRPVASLNNNPQAGNWLEFDISSAIQGAGQYSFVLDTTIGGLLGFSSVESGNNPPQMVLRNSTGENVINASEDASANVLRPNRNRGQSPVLQLMRTPSEHRRIYLQFDVPVTSIEGASLRLYLETAELDAQGGIAVYLAASNDWTDESLNWNNAPDILIDERPIDSFTIQR